MRSCAYSLEFHEKFLTKLLEPKAAGEMRHFLAALRAPPLLLYHYHYMIIIIVIYYYHLLLSNTESSSSRASLF